MYRNKIIRKQLFILLHYITCHLADAFIQSDLQLIDYTKQEIFPPGAMWG